MKVEIFITSSDSRYLDYANSMSEAILKTLDNGLRFKPEEKSYTYLKEFIEAKNVYDKEAWFHELLPAHLNIIYDFARDLRICDSLWPNCLLSKTKFGKAMIELLEYGQFRLVLTGRCWISIDELLLDFELVSVGSELYFQKHRLLGKQLRI